MSISDSERQSLRTQVVDEHVRLENRHDLNGIMTTFGAAARYDDEPWDAHYIGRDSVRAFYSDLLRALPDLQIDVQPRHASEATVILESPLRTSPGFLARPAADRSSCPISALWHLHIRRRQQGRGREDLL